MRQRSELTDPELAAHILARSDGLIGAVSRLPRQAAIRAVRSERERIGRDTLDRVRAMPAVIEDIAPSELL